MPLSSIRLLQIQYNFNTAFTFIYALHVSSRYLRAYNN